MRKKLQKRLARNVGAMLTKVSILLDQLDNSDSDTLMWIDVMHQLESISSQADMAMSRMRDDAEEFPAENDLHGEESIFADEEDDDEDDGPPTADVFIEPLG